MNVEKALTGELRETVDMLPEAISILVVDHDCTCLTIVTRMLRVSGYKVVTAELAADALSIVREREDKLHLVLMEVHLPDMDRYEFIEKMGAISKLPVVIMSSDANENAMLGGLFKGAMLYLLKPLTMNSIRNLWQFPFIKKRDRMMAPEWIRRVPRESARKNKSDKHERNRQLLNNMNHRYRMAKRKDREKMEKEGDDVYDSEIPKKPKLTWTDELHKIFLYAVRVLGIDRAHPKEILQQMSVPGLKKQNISSHLQKYRLSLKWKKDTTRGKIYRGCSKSSLALASYRHPSTLHLRDEFVRIANNRVRASSYQTKSGSHSQKVNSFISMPSLTAAQVPPHSDSAICNLSYGDNMSTSHVKNSCLGTVKSSTEFLPNPRRQSQTSHLHPTESRPPPPPPLLQELEKHDMFESVRGELARLPPQPPLPELEDGFLFESVNGEMYLPILQEQDENYIFEVDTGELGEKFNMATATTPFFNDEDFDSLW